MNSKPSSNEEEYFARQEIERRRKMAQERQAALLESEREQRRALHLMSCPKCGMELHEIAFGDVHVDKCFNCGGIWLDDGELERLQTKETGFVGRVLAVFRS
jgi:uncharacterized protein